MHGTVVFAREMVVGLLVFVKKFMRQRCRAQPTHVHGTLAFVIEKVVASLVFVKKINV